MFRSIRQMDAAVDKARVKAKRSQVRATAAALSSSQTSIKQKKDPGVPDLTKAKAALNRRAEREQLKEERRNRHSRDTRTPRTVNAASAARLPSAAPSSDSAAAASSSSFFTSSEPSDVAVSSQRRWYLKELHQVIAESDIVLEVLDARDPLGCRNPAIERAIISSLQTDQSQAKRLVLVLNKIDLVSAANLQAWMRHLKHFFPVIAFKASTQQQAAHLNRHEPSTHTMTAAASSPPIPSSSSSSSTSTSASSSSSIADLARSGCVGASSLIQLLKNYSRNLKMKKSITVGVIGQPNVGKSSLINSLKRSRAVAVGNRPGVTKALQQVRLDAQVTLIDSPGVIAVVEGGEGGAEDEGMLLRNVLSVDRLGDVVGSAEAVVRRVGVKQLVELYGLGEGVRDAGGVLVGIAKKQGKLLPGGVANVEVAARVLLQDLNVGKVRYETDVPKEGGEGVGGRGVGLVGEAEVVMGWAREFDVEELLREKGPVRVEGKEDVGQEDGADMEVERSSHEAVG